MRRFPNASTLNIITQDDARTQASKILFVAALPVPDIYPQKSPYWYPNKGKNGKASTVWDIEKIKQWYATGNDNDILQLFDDLLSKGSIVIDGTTFNFDIPLHRSSVEHPNLYSRNQNDEQKYISEDKSYFPRIFLEQNNLKMLTGYAEPTAGISPLWPTGVFDEDFLYSRVSTNVFAIRQQRKPYLTFRGVREQKDSDPQLKQMAGFLQIDRDISTENVVTFRNDSGITVARTEIGNPGGTFIADLIDESGKGTVAIHQNKRLLSEQPYVLLKGFKINTGFGRTETKDVYNRTIETGGSNAVRPTTFKNKSFHRDIYAQPGDANAKLSDAMRSAFNYLGPKILVIDPYYFGTLKGDDATYSYEYSDCQTAFLNALVSVALQTGLDELVFLGFNKKAKTIVDVSGTGMTSIGALFHRYDYAFRSFISAGTLSEFFKQNSIQFKNSQTEFHGRYWCSINPVDRKIERCICVTNSIGIMTDVDFIEVTDEDQKAEITAKYSEHLKQATDEVII